jgi:hypothetical protein
MRFLSLILFAALISARPTLGQLALEPTTATSSPLPSDTSDEPSDEGWSFSVSAYTYFVPDDHEYIQPTITADRDWLHLEARYNYEDLNTASVWIGYNLAGGEKLAWEFTPMFGGVFGDTSGGALGYKGSLSWWKIELYSEGEYLVDADDSSDSYFYNWSELTFAPVEWFRFGLVTQRTRVYEADRDIQRGLLVGFSFERVDIAAYVLNPDDSDPVVALALRFDF